MYTREDYLSVISSTINSIDAILNEIDSEILNNFNKRVPLEIRHDVVPIVKKLNEARKEACVAQSLFADS